MGESASQIIGMVNSSWMFFVSPLLNVIAGVLILIPTKKGSDVAESWPGWPFGSLNALTAHEI